MNDTQPSFLYNEMLARLARWLRAAGYDTEVVEPGRSDRDLLRQAGRENRLLVTCDRKILEHRAADGIALVVAAGPIETQVRQLSEALAVDWLLAPFTRCLVDNEPVRPATDDEIAAIPERGPGVRRPFTTCPACGRRYWWGGHTARMIKKLEAWAGSGPAASPVER